MTTTSYNIYQQITSVRVATTANLPSNYFNGDLNNGVGATLTALSVGALSIDGILLEVGNRVLVKDQTSTNQNGLYVVQSPGSFAGLWFLERAPDFQSVEQLKVGQYFTVGAGATLAGAMYVLVEPLPETIGLSNFNFVDVGGSGSSGPFLLKAANLSDLLNRETGFSNLGLGSGDFLIIDEIDFVAGLYTLTNPCPNFILVNATNPGNAVRLPPVDEAESFIPSQGPVFFIDEGFEGIDVQDSTGAVISPLEAPACEQFVLTSNAFPQGVWFVRSFVSTVNGKSGDVVLSNSDQMIYVSTSGSDSISADGSILNPYASLSFALSQITTASETTPFEIVMATGVYAEAGNVSLKPWVHIEGNNAILNIAGQLLLHASWGTVTNPRTFVRFMNISASGGALLNRTVFQANSLLFFNAVNFQGTPTVNASGAGTNIDAEVLAFFYCLPLIGNGPSFTLTNLISVCIGSGIQSGATIINDSAITNNVVLIENAAPFDGNLTLQTTNSGVMIAILSAVPRISGTFTIDGTNIQIILDSTSWNFTPTFLNGATISQFILNSKSDGENATSYIPSNFTPVGSTTYSVDSVTAYLRGIDNALAGAVGNVIKQQLWVNFTDGLDTNQGGLNDPFKTYAAATAFAALTASPTNRFLIRIIGDNSSTTPVLYPYMDLLFSNGTFTVTGGWTLDSSWDTVVNNEVVTIEGMKLNGFWAFSWIGNSGNVVRFLNCDHSLTVSGSFISNSPAFNELMIINDTSPDATGYSGNLFITQSKSYLQAVKVAQEIRYDLTQDGYAVIHYLYDSFIPFAIVLKKSVPNTSVQKVYVKNTPMSSGSPVLSDDLSNVVIDTDSYLSDPTFLLTGTYANILTLGVNGIRQQIWVNDSVGNDANNGSINAPFKTYDTARSFASSLASPTNRFLINVRGDFTLAGDFNINPYIDLNFEDSTVTVSGGGGILLDSSWTVSNEKVTIFGFKPICAAGLNLFWASSAFGGNVITFNNPNFAQCASAFLSNTGDSSFNENTICIFNDLNPFPTSFTSGAIVSEIKSRLQGVNFGGNLTYLLSDDDYNIDHYLYNCYITGTLSVTRASGNSIQRLGIRNTFITNPIQLDSQGSQVFIDSDSYSEVPVLGGLNVYDDFVISDITDGVLMNSFTPSGWVFVSGTYPTNALTGHLKGIDNALSALTIPYVETSSLTNVMSPNVQYTANNAAVVSLTLPATSSPGDKIIVNGKGAGGWRIDQQNAGHVIHVGAVSTTVGVAGSVASTNRYDSITITCITANNEWVAQGSEGTFTIV